MQQVNLSLLTKGIYLIRFQAKDGTYRKKVIFNVLNMKNIFILIGITLFLSSCDKPVYHNIPKNEKPLLKDNDTVVFIEKGSKELDSFLIIRSDGYRVSDKRYYQEEIFIHYNCLNESSSIDKFGFRHGASIIIFIRNNDFPIYGNADPVSVIVNGTSYQSIYIRHAFNFPDSIPNTVYYSHQHGIIRYNYSDGRCYELK